MSFSHIKAGDVIKRMLAGTIPVKLKVSFITDELIVCGEDVDSGWCFDRKGGFEVDELLGWGRRDDGEIITGSFLIPCQDD